MKKIAILSFLAFSAIGCSQTATTTVTTNQTTTNQTTTNQTTTSNSNNLIVARGDGKSGEKTSLGHAPENNKPPMTSGNPSSKPGGESPMTRAVDVSEMSAAIEKAEKDYKAKANDTTKNALADAYFKRAFALTEAAQYRSAIGDFRKGLKLNPTDAEAKDMHDQIVSIFQSLGKEPPKEGEEPAPMPIQN